MADTIDLSGPSQTAAHRKVVMRFHEEVFNQRKLEVIDEVLHPEYSHHDAGTRSADEHKKLLAEQLAGSTNFRVRVDKLIVDGDLAAAEVTWFEGKRQVRNGVAIFELQDGLIISDRFWSRPL